jgi:DNA polymerase-3 subunit gamma/tau
MALMQISYLNAASQDAEKKNELSSGFENQTPSKTLEQAPAPVKFSAQPIVQTSNKPVVGFNELKIKSQFLLQDNNLKNQTIAVEANIINETVATIDVELTSVRALDAVKQFAEEKSKSGNKQLYATLTSSKISLIDHTILIELNNEVQKEMLVTIKQDMLDELRKLVSNKQMQLEIKVSEIVGEVKAYKPSDKFKLMAEKNPALLELKKRFDLDIEY